MANDNPLLSPSPLPYGLPDYAAIRPEHYLPAFERGVRRAHARDPSDHPGALDARRSRTRWSPLEASGKLLGDVSRTFYTVSSADATPEIQEIEEQLAPLMSAHQDSIQLDSRAVLAHQDAARSARRPRPRSRAALPRGAALPRDVARRAPGWTTTPRSGSPPSISDCRRSPRPSRRTCCATPTTSPSSSTTSTELDGLAEGELSAAAQAAADRGLEGKWVVTLTLFTGHPYLVVPDEPRRAASGSWMHHARAARAAARTTTATVLREIVQLRAERAALLGYDSHAAYITSDETAGSPEAVHDLLRRLAVPARATRRASRRRCRRSSTPSRSRSRSRRTTGRSTPRRCAPPSTTSTARALRPWFEAERVLQDGVFRAATELYGVTFTERADLGGVPPRRAGVRGAQRRRLDARAVHPRPLHARHQARRRVDELDRVAVAPARHAADRRQQPQRSQARRRAGRRSSRSTR